MPRLSSPNHLKRAHLQQATLACCAACPGLHLQVACSPAQSVNCPSPCGPEIEGNLTLKRGLQTSAGSPANKLLPCDFGSSHQMPDLPAKALSCLAPSDCPAHLLWASTMPTAPLCSNCICILACHLQACHGPAYLPRVSNMPTAIWARTSGSSLVVATPRRVSASEMLRVSPSVSAMIRVARASLSLRGSCLLCP